MNVTFTKTVPAIHVSIDGPGIMGRKMDPARDTTSGFRMMLPISLVEESWALMAASSASWRREGPSE